MDPLKEHALILMKLLDNKIMSFLFYIQMQEGMFLFPHANSLTTLVDDNCN